MRLCVSSDRGPTQQSRQVRFVELSARHEGTLGYLCRILLRVLRSDGSRQGVGAQSQDQGRVEATRPHL